MPFLDGVGEFDNVMHKRLLHNLVKRRIDKQIIKWINSFLTNRTTVLKTGKFTSDLMKIIGRFFQKPTIFRILYLFHNINPLKDVNQHDSSLSIGYIDDIVILVADNSNKDNCRNLEIIYKTIWKLLVDT